MFITHARERLQNNYKRHVRSAKQQNRGHIIGVYAVTIPLELPRNATSIILIIAYHKWGSASPILGHYHSNNNVLH